MTSFSVKQIKIPSFRLPTPQEKGCPLPLLTNEGTRQRRMSPEPRTELNREVW